MIIQAPGYIGVTVCPALTHRSGDLKENTFDCHFRIIAIQSV